MSKWYENNGASSDVVLSTKIKLERNLSNYPFPNKLDDETKQEICEKVRDCLLSHTDLNLKYIQMSDLTNRQAVSLAERHLISPEFATVSPGKALLVSDDEEIAIMINEDDHIAIQVTMGGLEPEKALERANEVDDIINSQFEYAFDERLGYLTQTPTNLGTGMKASVNVHLPAISNSNTLSSLAATLTRLGLTIHGVYGDTSSSTGDIYKISNLVSLGLSEKDAIENLKNVVMQIATQERAAAEKMVANVSIVDKIQRAYGILSSARLLSTREMLELFSFVRLGSVYNIIKADISAINELTETMQSASLCVINGRDMNMAERDEKRAQTVRNRLFNNI